MMYLQSYILILCHVISSESTNSPGSIFAPSVFIFYDKGDKLKLDMEITSLKFWCLGGILSPDWILTSAICFKRENRPDPQRYIVVPSRGTVYETSNGIEPYVVKKIVMHESWAAATGDGVNIALILRSKISNSVKLRPHSLTGTINVSCKPKKHPSEFCFILEAEEDSCYIVHGGLLECTGSIQGIAISGKGGDNPMCSEGKNFTKLSVRFVDLSGFNEWINSRMVSNGFEQKRAAKESHFSPRSGAKRSLLISKGILLISVFLILFSE